MYGGAHSLCFTPNEKAGVGLGGITAYIGPGPSEMIRIVRLRAIVYIGALGFIASRLYGEYGPELTTGFAPTVRNPIVKAGASARGLT